MTYDYPPVNPYDPALQNPQPQTLPLDEIVKLGFRGQALSLRVCLPCVVTQVNGNQNVNLQPLLKARYIDGQVSDMPSIQNVPVSMPMGQNYSVKLPVAVLDTGYCVFSDKSLDAWLAGSGQSVDTQDSRIHDINDAIFVPGLVPFSKQTTDGTTDLVITNGSAQARVQAAGKFQFKNSQNELLDLLDQLLNVMINETYTLTLLGPQPFIGYTTELLQQIRDKLDTLKGP